MTFASAPPTWTTRTAATIAAATSKARGSLMSLDAGAMLLSRPAAPLPLPMGCGLPLRLGAGGVTLELGNQQLGVERGDQVLEWLGPGFEHLDDPLRRDLPGKPVHHHVDLLADQLLERLLVAKGVVDREADLLVVAAGAEAADRLDDLDVRGRVAAAVGGEDLQLGKAVEDLLGDAVALAHLGGAGPRPLAGERPVEDSVLQLQHRAGSLGTLGEHRPDRLQRHEALLLQALDQLDPVDELGWVVGHVAAGLDRLRQQPLAQVVLDRRRRHPRCLGQLAHPQQLGRFGGSHARNSVGSASVATPATAPDSSIAVTSAGE